MPSRHARLGLLALTTGGFGIGLTEFVILGLLPEVAATYRVSEAAAGGLVSGYALAVGVGGIGLTLLATHLDRKRTLVALMALFVGGNALSAAAPTYGLMLGGRVLAALCHGAFFGIGSVVAAGLVDKDRQAGAIAALFAGLTTATVLGVPLGTWVGQAFGWRTTFWAIAGIGVVALFGLSAFVPSTEHLPQGNVRRELVAFRTPQVWASMAVTVLGFGGMFGAFTYVAYVLTEVSGYAPPTVPWLLVLFGSGLFVGNLAGGRAADRSVSAALHVTLAVLTVVLTGFAMVAGSRAGAAVSLVLVGAFGFATVPPLQMRILRYATSAPTLASGANIAAFNTGNAIGAWLGGLAIGAGWGFRSPIWIGAAMTAAGE